MIYYKLHLFIGYDYKIQIRCCSGKTCRFIYLALIVSKRAERSNRKRRLRNYLCSHLSTAGGTGGVQVPLLACWLGRTPSELKPGPEVDVPLAEKAALGEAQLLRAVLNRRRGSACRPIRIRRPRFHVKGAPRFHSAFWVSLRDSIYIQFVHQRNWRDFFFQQNLDILWVSCSVLLNHAMICEIILKILLNHHRYYSTTKLSDIFGRNTVGNRHEECKRLTLTQRWDNGND